VLFLCTGNSARSQMAEALAEQQGARGLQRRQPPQAAARRGRARHARLRHRPLGRRSKHLTEFTRRRFDAVVTLCDRVREVCPEFPGDPEPIHWSIPDPSREGDAEAFERTAADLAARIPSLLKLIEEAS
jgi:protein-tyrosine-phosphatase